MPRGFKLKNFANLLVIGWREWVSLPELGIDLIKAKIDTGARTSALHAFDVKVISKNRKKMVRFKIHPDQKDATKVVKAIGELVEMRQIRNSGGSLSLRPVIRTAVTLGIFSWKIELTLINRDEMGFRMLLGREALRGHLLVNPAHGYLLGKRFKKKKKARKI